MLLWSNDSCTAEHNYRCSASVDLSALVKLSIDRSMCYLDKNVFSLRSPGHDYGRRAEHYMQNKHKLATQERFLHKEVKHWKQRGLCSIRWTAFNETIGDQLPLSIITCIKHCLIAAPSRRSADQKVTRNSLSIR
jgi:hypothetical protein